MSRFRPIHLVALAAILTSTVCGGDGGGTEPDPPEPPANRAPIAVGSLGTLTIGVGPLVISVEVSSNFRDPDGDPLTYTATTSDPSVVDAVMDGSKVAVTAAGPGTATVTVTARDPDGLTATQALVVTVNAPPQPVGEIDDQELNVGDTVTINLGDFFTDPDGDELNFEAASSDEAVATASIDGGTATILGHSVGSATLTFTARDQFGEATQEADVTVATANRAPEVSDTIPTQTVTAGDTVTIDLSAHFTDPDGDTLSYEAASSDEAVATVTLDGSVASVAGVAEGSATLTFTASDPAGLSATQEVPAGIQRANDAPVPEGMIDSLAVEEGKDIALVVSGYFSDPDGDNLTYEAESSNEAVATAAVEDSTVTISGKAFGTATITVTASDPYDASATQEAVVSVKTPPMPDSLPPTHDMMVGNHVVLDFATFFTDEDGDDLTYTATTSDAAVATASVEGSMVTTTAAESIEDSVGTVVTLTVTATDPAGLSAEQMAMVRVSAAAYGTLPGLTVDSLGVLKGSLGGLEIALTQCLVLDNFPFENQLITAHWSEWQLAAGTGWVTAPRTYRDGSGIPAFNLCPVLDWDDREAGTYRMVGHMTIITTDTADATADTVTSTLRSPSFENKPGGGPARDASFSGLQPGGPGPLDAAARRAEPLRFSSRGAGFAPPPIDRPRIESAPRARGLARPSAFARSRGDAGWGRPPPRELRG